MIPGTHDGADIVIVNTCGFLDRAEIESLVYVAGANDLTIDERIPERITNANDYDLFGVVTEGSSTAATN